LIRFIEAVVLSTGSGKLEFGDQEIASHDASCTPMSHGVNHDSFDD